MGEVDFPKFGVGVQPGIDSAGWLQCWGEVKNVAVLKRGTAFFLTHCSRGFEGGTQAGELSICRDIHGNDLLQIVAVVYDDNGRHLSTVPVTSSPPFAPMSRVTWNHLQPDGVLTSEEID